MVKPILSALAVLALAGCEQSYFEAAWSPGTIGTLAPKDARFEVRCAKQCGRHGQQAATTIDVTFGEKYARHFAICCDQKDAVVARLGTVNDLWCRGLAVAPKAYGDLTVATTTSELNGKRAATLDQGEGYVSFQCGQWLPQLIAKLEAARCCGR